MDFKSLKKDQLSKVIDEANEIVKTVDPIKNKAKNSPYSLLMYEQLLLDKKGHEFLRKLQKIASLVEQDQSLMLMSVQGPYKESTNVISWMMSAQPWFEDLEKYMRC